MAEAYNKKEGKSRKLEPAPDVEESSEVLQELPGTKEVTAERSEHGEASNDSEVSAVSNRSSDVGNRNSDLIEEDVDQQSGQTNGESPGSSHNGK